MNKLIHHALATATGFLPKSVLLLGFLSAHGQITISSCQEKARTNYPSIKQYELITRSMEYTLSNANKAYLPQISLTGIAGYIFKGLPTVSLPGSEPASPSKTQLIGIGQLNQVIWDGGATSSSKEIAKSGAAVETANLDVQLYNIRERVNQLYFGILVIDEQLKQLSLVTEDLTRNINKLQLSKDNGLALQPDIDELKAEQLSLEQKKIEFNFTRKGYVEMLSYMIGEPLAASIQLERPAMPDPVASLENHRPELTLFASQRKLVEAQSSINRVMSMPKIGLLGAGVWLTPGVSFATSKMTSLSIAGLSVSWNTSGIYKSSNNKGLDQVQLDRIASQQETFIFNNSLQMKSATTEIDKQNAVLENDDAIVNLKTKIKNAYQLKYENGMCPMNDLINAISKENESLSNRALHQIQLLMNLYNYKTISGN